MKFYRKDVHDKVLQDVNDAVLRAIAGREKKKTRMESNE